MPRMRARQRHNRRGEPFTKQDTMITKTTKIKFRTDGGGEFDNLSDAQAFELTNLLTVSVETAERIVEHSIQVMDILTTTPTSKPRARKVNGGTKTRKTASTPATPAA